MSERVSQFLVTLSQDPVMLDEFLSDPDPFLVQSELTPEERDVLRSGDPDRIRFLLGDDDPARWAATTSTDPGAHPGPKPGPPPGPQPGPPPPPPDKPKG